MPFQKGKSGNAKGAEPGSRAPSNKQIKNAIKKCSIEAIENLSRYMTDCSDYIDACWGRYHLAIELAEAELDDKLRKEKIDEAEDIRKNIFSYYSKLADVSQTLLEYAHKHIVNDERINKTTKAVDEDNDKEPAPRVSLKAI